MYIKKKSDHLALVELHLAAGEESKQKVDPGCDEAVVAHFVVEIVDPLRRILTEGRHINITVS